VLGDLELTIKWTRGDVLSAEVGPGEGKSQYIITYGVWTSIRGRERGPHKSPSKLKTPER